MPRHLKALIAVFYLVASVGGVWFGLFSCGGYAVHKQLMAWSLVLMAVATIATPPFSRSNLWRRFAFSAGLFAAFYLCRALSAPFYLADFQSFGDYLSQVRVALEFGPC